MGTGGLLFFAFDVAGAYLFMPLIMFIAPHMVQKLWSVSADKAHAAGAASGIEIALRALLLDPARHTLPVSCLWSSRATFGTETIFYSLPICIEWCCLRHKDFHSDTVQLFPIVLLLGWKLQWFVQ
jgi:hypothetical protein